MSEQTRRRRDTTPLNGPDPEDNEKLRQLRGDRPADDQGVGVFSADQVDGLGELTDSDQYLGEGEAGVHDDLPGDPESLELLTELELRDGETDDAFTASDEGMTYVPPIDPPTLPSAGPAGAEVASGFGVSALDETYGPDSAASFLPDDDQLEALVREAIRAESATSPYADTLTISARGGVVTLWGLVADLEDADNLAAAAAYVEGVVEVVDELAIRGFEREAEQ